MDEKEVSLSCFAKQFSPKNYTIKWLKNNEEISIKPNENNMLFEEETKNGTLFSATSFLTVPINDWTENVMFTCHFSGIGENNIRTSTNSNITTNVCKTTTTMGE